MEHAAGQDDIQAQIAQKQADVAKQRLIAADAERAANTQAIEAGKDAEAKAKEIHDKLGYVPEADRLRLGGVIQKGLQAQAQADAINSAAQAALEDYNNKKNLADKSSDVASKTTADFAKKSADIIQQQQDAAAIFAAKQAAAGPEEADKIDQAKKKDQEEADKGISQQIENTRKAFEEAESTHNLGEMNRLLQQMQSLFQSQAGLNGAQRDQIAQLIQHMEDQDRKIQELTDWHKSNRPGGT
jgi:hypothetical protein